MTLWIYTMMRNFFQRLAEAWTTMEVATFNGLTGISRKPFIRISVALGVRPQRIAMFFLVLSLSLDAYNQLLVYESPGPLWAWVVSVTIHALVLGSAINVTTNMLRRLETTGELMLSEGFLSVQKMSSFWLLLTIISVGGATGALLAERDIGHGLQVIENIFDILTILFTWTLMTKPPSLWSRLKDRVEDWKPTLVPVPHGV